MRQAYILRFKTLVNEVFFAYGSFGFALLTLMLIRSVHLEPESYVLQLVVQITEIAVTLHIVTRIMERVPGVFRVPFARDRSLIASVILLLVDWQKMSATFRGLRL